MVPPLGRMPETDSRVSSSMRFSTMPSQPSATPKTRPLWTLIVFWTTARMTAFKPGQSPPPVRTPMLTMWLFQNGDGSPGRRLPPAGMLVHSGKPENNREWPMRCQTHRPSEVTGPRGRAAGLQRMMTKRPRQLPAGCCSA